MRPRALTFIELLIVIIIIGILAGLALPNFRKSFNSTQAEGFSRQLQSYINYLRDKSAAGQQVIFLVIDTQNKSYSAWVQAEGRPFKTYPLPEGVNIEIAKKSNIDDPRIYFYPDGRIDAVDIKVSSGNKEIILTTEGAFGRIKIKK